MLTSVVAGLFDLLAPRTCPGCDLDLEPGCESFCGACEVLLEVLAPVDGSGAAYVFGGPLADAIRRLKYAGRTDISRALGTLLASACADLAGRVDAVIPIPLHPRRLRERGFNQASLLAVPVARRLGEPLLAGALRRSRD
ncbi:MAG: ComF family protein, partial [Myxococcota bacterium]|nr:ComF family protein [Myxococcota bacterium]